VQKQKDGEIMNKNDNGLSWFKVIIILFTIIISTLFLYSSFNDFGEKEIIEVKSFNIISVIPFEAKDIVCTTGIEISDYRGKVQECYSDIGKDCIYAKGKGSCAYTIKVKKGILG